MKIMCYIGADPEPEPENPQAWPSIFPSNPQSKGVLLCPEDTLSTFWRHEEQWYFKSTKLSHWF